MDLNAWLADVKLIACVGSGGVGKTTTAAAIGLWAATQGRKVMVLTIDPAKRLANSLGLESMGGDPTPIDLSSLPDATGELYAMMLDSRGTFDTLIASVAPSDEARERILSNHIYRHMADALAGSQDYMATEKLYDLVSSGDYDLVVLDTPPVKNALDFLEAPGRVVSFLDERVLSWFLAPYEKKQVWGSRLLAGTSAIVFRLLGYIFGKEFLDDFAAFLQDFNGLYEGFRTRHQAVLDLLRADDTAFVTVCAPHGASMDIAVFFQEELAKRNLPRGGVIANQMHSAELPDLDVDAALGELAESLDDDLPEGTRNTLFERIRHAHERLQAIVQAERKAVAEVRSVATGGFYQEVPRIEGEVNDLASLHEVGRYLFARAAERIS